MMRTTAADNEAQPIGVDDGLDFQSVAESELPELRRDAQAWLVANNRSDQRAITVFALVLLAIAPIWGAWWTVVLAGCVLLVLPFRWIAAPHFRRGDLRRGIGWANVGSWYLLFPLVLIVPETLPIAMQNLIGPAILAATYLERRVVRRMVPATIAIAIALSWVSYVTDGVGLDQEGPYWLFLAIVLAYVGANMWLVMGDIQEFNAVHLRSLQNAVVQNRELRTAEQALRDSRRRLLVAGDEERIRLERDLHDGAQQRLVALALQLRLATELAEEGTPPTSDSLMAMHRAATEAVDELRDLAQGVYPARLTEIGLARALHAVARRSPVPIEIVDELTEEIDEPTQVALYFVCVEAIQNATKHGDAGTAITITMASDDGLRLTIADDGPGFDPDQHGESRGLLNMSDRVGALGGEFEIRSAHGAGTVVEARLPHRLLATAGADR